MYEIGIAKHILHLPTEISWLSTLMAMFGRFFITYAMNTGTQITFEVVPTELRGQGNALANVFGQLGMFFSPYIVYSVVFHEALPFLILTVGSFLGAAVSALLPEQCSRVPPLISICARCRFSQCTWG